MKKLKLPDERPPMLNGGKPTFEEVKVTKADDLLAQMERANSDAVAAENYKHVNTNQFDVRRLFDALDDEIRSRPNPCRIGCNCPPCLEGECSYCLIDEAKRRGDRREVEYLYEQYRSRDERPYRRGLRGRPDQPYRRDFRNERDRWRVVAEEWMRVGGEWDMYNDRPVLYNDEEYERWSRFERRMDEVFKSEAQREYEYEMRKLEYDRRMFELPVRFIGDADIFGKWGDKDQDK